MRIPSSSLPAPQSPPLAAGVSAASPGVSDATVQQLLECQQMLAAMSVMSSEQATLEQAVCAELKGLIDKMRSGPGA
jgi:DNA-binding transcriptional regulator YdaS (Cro superfamily)